MTHLSQILIRITGGLSSIRVVVVPEIVIISNKIIISSNNGKDKDYNRVKRNYFISKKLVLKVRGVILKLCKIRILILLGFDPSGF